MSRRIDWATSWAIPVEPRGGSLGALPPAKGRIIAFRRYISVQVETAPVLEGLSLDMQAGQSLGIIGPSWVR